MALTTGRSIQYFQSKKATISSGLLPILKTHFNQKRTCTQNACRSFSHKKHVTASCPMFAATPQTVTWPFFLLLAQPSGPPWAVSHSGAMDGGSELPLVEVPEELRKASVESGNGASTEKKFLTRCGSRAKRSTHDFSPEKYGLPHHKPAKGI